VQCDNAELSNSIHPALRFYVLATTFARSWLLSDVTLLLQVAFRVIAGGAFGIVDAARSVDAFRLGAVRQGAFAGAIGQSNSR
jgi:hypothetical protein